MLRTWRPASDLDEAEDTLDLLGEKGWMIDLRQSPCPRVFEGLSAVQSRVLPQVRVSPADILDPAILDGCQGVHGADRPGHSADGPKRTGHS